MKRICENCKTMINKKENYFKISEFISNKEKSIKFVHKRCQDIYDEKLKQSLGTHQMAQKILVNADAFMKNLGVPEVVEIK